MRLAEAMEASKLASMVKPQAAAVQFLEKQLQQGDAEIRRNAVATIQKLPAPDSQILELASKLATTHENWFVKRAVADTLTQLVLRDSPKTGEEAVRMAAGFLEHQDAEMRRCGGRMLVDVVAQPAKQRPKEPLPGEAVPEPSAEERVRADDMSKAAAAAAAQRLSSERPEVRGSALEAMARMGEWATPHANSIAALVGDPVLALRHEAIRSMDTLGVAVSSGAGTIAAFFEHKEEQIRLCAKRALLQVAKHDGASASEAAAAMLRSPKVAARRSAVQLLIELGPQAAPHCEAIARLLDDEDKSLRAQCARALASSAAGKAETKRVERCLRLVLARMERPEDDMRQAAVDCMRGLSPVMGKAARSQGRVFTEDADGMTADHMLQRKLRAIEVLGGAGANAKPYLEEIAKELESQDWRLRRVAMYTLEDLKEHAADNGAKEVARRLLHEDPCVRRAAAETLGRMGMHAGGYCHRLETMRDSEEDEDALRVVDAALVRLRACGAFEVEEPGVARR